MRAAGRPSGEVVVGEKLLRGPGIQPARKSERRKVQMRFSEKISEAGATGYILLWLLGIPIPVLILIFLLRGCT
jgi:hypothetical protein